MNDVEFLHIKADTERWPGDANRFRRIADRLEQYEAKQASTLGARLKATHQ